jgi:uncharacterized protein HemY
MTPSNGSFWNTLGVASYRAGQWQDAVDALKKSVQFRSGGNIWDWFFLAMAHRQLGYVEANATTEPCSGWTRTSPTMKIFAAFAAKRRPCSVSPKGLEKSS